MSSDSDERPNITKRLDCLTVNPPRGGQKRNNIFSRSSERARHYLFQYFLCRILRHLFDKIRREIVKRCWRLDCPDRHKNDWNRNHSHPLTHMYLLGRKVESKRRALTRFVSCPSCFVSFDPI